MRHTVHHDRPHHGFHHHNDRNPDGHGAGLNYSTPGLIDTELASPAIVGSGEPHSSHLPAAGPAASSTAQDTSALLAVIGGDAYAAGLSTDTSGTVVNNVKDLGNVTVASGYAIFEATATSPGDDAAAGADTFVSVTGADIVLTFDFDIGFKIGNTVVAASETSYLAIDIENWSSPNGPLVLDFQAHAAPGHHGQGGAHLPELFQSLGNLAHVTAVADAQGPNTLTSTLTQALTIENHFSYVSGMAIAAA